MAALLDATREQIDALDAVTDTLVSVEHTIASLLAARDGLLALGNRIALETAAAARTDDGSAYLGHDGADLAVRAVAAEFGAALRVSDRTVQRRMADADLLVTLFPAVWRAQGAGDISPAHARAIVDAGMHLEDEAEREAYTTEILEYAAEESPNRVRRQARRIAERHQRRTIDERHRAARADRAVWVKDLGDGMAELGLRGPSALVHGAFDRLTNMAKTAREEVPVPCEHGAVPSGAGASQERMLEVAPDTRTLAQARSDLALDLLLSGAPSGHSAPDGALAAIRGSVSITVPVLTLMGITTTPAEIDGHAPIDADTARQLAGSAPGWDRVLTHPVTDAVVAVDRYRPSADLKRLVRARDQRCRFPCCGFPARDCDLDHIRDHALGGETSSDNLSALCRRHHVLKHHSPWHVENLGGGFHAWTSPAGRVYVDTPPETNVTPAPRDADPPF
ncbi:HNH endonuclease signature motif containing protein [Microbacterium hydrocarbonoxydans]|uniref:HNH endonuclease signature motif containing protein n=1 Tax=Microbacterium hydrocarbonoxydans TaxID=273678 RepID=UPI00203EAFFD|nr:HNH endonuclease signature motif containing protein [Microbacterium hydrocarbonoxydans]MCM3779168.1 HNH endonuclease [Microbacterium hydrocarbonoxydans]